MYVLLQLIISHWSSGFITRRLCTYFLRRFKDGFPLFYWEELLGLIILWTLWLGGAIAATVSVVSLSLRVFQFIRCLLTFHHALDRAPQVADGIIYARSILPSWCFHGWEQLSWWRWWFYPLKACFNLYMAGTRFWRSACQTEMRVELCCLRMRTLRSRMVERCHPLYELESLIISVRVKQIWRNRRVESVL